MVRFRAEKGKDLDGMMVILRSENGQKLVRFRTENGHIEVEKNDQKLVR
jgi:hypothetical protein